MTDIDETIAAVLRLDAEATPGPWDYWFEVGTRLGPSREHPVALVKRLRHARCPGGVRGAGVDADAALIAYYRTAAPALAREVQRLQAELATAHRTWAERCSAWSDGMEEAEAQRDAALAVLRQVEWRGEHYGDRGTCPACGCSLWPNDIAHTGHASTCALAACLRAAEVTP